MIGKHIIVLVLICLLTGNPLLHAMNVAGIIPGGAVGALVGVYAGSGSGVIAGVNQNGIVGALGGLIAGAAVGIVAGAIIGGAIGFVVWPEDRPAKTQQQPNEQR